MNDYITAGTTGTEYDRDTTRHNNFFSLSRLWKYCTKQLYEKKRNLLLQFLTLSGVYTVCMILMHNMDPDIKEPFISTWSMQFFIWVCFFFYIAKCSSLLAEQIAARSKKVLFLSVPVSTAEKYAAHLLSAIFLYPLLFFASIIVAQYASELLFSLIHKEGFNPGTPLAGCLSSLYGADTHIAFTLHITTTLVTVTTFTLGATLWPKNSFLKTLSVNILLGIVILALYSILFSSAEVDATLTYIAAGPFLNSTTGLARSINIYQLFLSACFLYIGYLRLKELEINETKR